MSTFVVQTSHLTKRYGDHTAVNDLSLNVEQGEVFGFLGHNGAGKTTTIHMLTTLLKPTSGTALVCGKSITTESLEARRHIGYVPENVRLYDTMSARSNLRFFARLSGVENPDRRIDETGTLVIGDQSNPCAPLVEVSSEALNQRRFPRPEETAYHDVVGWHGGSSSRKGKVSRAGRMYAILSRTPKSGR